MPSPSGRPLDLSRWADHQLGIIEDLAYQNKVAELIWEIEDEGERARNSYAWHKLAMPGTKLPGRMTFSERQPADTVGPFCGVGGGPDEKKLIDRLGNR